jgi:2-oxoisovalerate dehydrogenase E1 component
MAPAAGTGMSVSRAKIVDENFKRHVERLEDSQARPALDQVVWEGSSLDARTALRLFEAQIESRILDFVARELKAEGEGYYTIGGSGHEGNAVIGAQLRDEDMAFLHYRSGALFCARAQRASGGVGPFDVLRGVVAAADEPIAGGRHKVFGSVGLNIPPQTSTIASHLPKAVGYAVSLDRRAHLEGSEASGIAVCSFGDASANHASATTAFNAAAWTSYQRVPAPVLFVCEDNGTGISVRTPSGWIRANFSQRAGLRYFEGDGLALPSAWDACAAAMEFVRRERRPAFLHLRTCRLMGHAGSDVEQLYRSTDDIEANEALDPLLASATLLVEGGWMRPAEVLELYEDTRERFRAMAREAKTRRKLESAVEVMEPLAPGPSQPSRSRLAEASARSEHFSGRLPESEERPRHLALQINRGLRDILLAHPRAILFGEDVARKGGVYHVTHELSERFGLARVFNTLLDETMILGLAIGAGHAGLLPIPEVQYLAYLMNAIDQLRGEAGSMQFFSRAQFSNPMVVRIAALAYQKGFGGHFHNDNGIAALLEIPGLLVGCPARGRDAVRMLRSMVAAAETDGRVAVVLEPIALYMTRDLHEEGDGEWLTTYPPPEDHMPVGEVGVHGDGNDLCIASYANGLWMSLRVAKRLEARGIACRVIDLRWLAPLPIEGLMPHARATGNLLIVDECRRGSGIADRLYARIHAQCEEELRLAVVAARDTYIPLGGAANFVLVQEEEIELASLDLIERSGP